MRTEYVKEPSSGGCGDLFTLPLFETSSPMRKFPCLLDAPTYQTGVVGCFLWSLGAL